MEKSYTSYLENPYTSHCRLLLYICDALPVEVQIHKRVIKFFHKVLNSSNPLLHTFGIIAVEGSCSSACNSINVILQRYNINKYDFYTRSYANYTNQLYASNSLMFSETDSQTASLIRELCQARDGKLNTIFSRHELIDAIETLCVQ